MTQPEMLGHVFLHTSRVEEFVHRGCGSSQEDESLIWTHSVLHAIKPMGYRRR